MPSLFTVQFSLTGWTGGPGLNTWCFTAGQQSVDQSTVEEAATELRTFYFGLRTYFLNTYRVRATGEAKEYEISSGQLIQVWPYSPPADVVGSDIGSATSRATMAKLQLYTNTVAGNRLLQGGPYIGPIMDSAMEADGTIKQAFISEAQAGLQATISGIGPKLQVWHRPTGKPPTGGVAGDVTQVNVWGTPAVLRSRRD